MPYRIDLTRASTASECGAGSLRPGRTEVFDRLVQLGAIDVETCDDGGLAALMPDDVAPEDVARMLAVDAVTVSAATPRDDGSVWVLRPRPIRIGPLRIAPANTDAPEDAVRLIDAPVFGTGLHPTTALCLEVLAEIVEHGRPDAVLDVGTGSGVLALAALKLGVPNAAAIDIDQEALDAASANARLNGLDARLRLVRGGPDAIEGTWPLVLANILAAPLIEIAPALVRRVGHRGSLVVSGIAVGLEGEVERAYRHLGMRPAGVRSRAGWVALVMQAAW